jgi:hypothetical protein
VHPAGTSLTVHSIPVAAGALLLGLAAPAAAALPGPPTSQIRSYVEAHCLDCHDGPDGKAGLDLAHLGMGLDDRKTFVTWVKVWDRVRDGEMPPSASKPGAPRITRAQTDAFLKALADPLVATDDARAAAEGRATRRRLNRQEYEHNLRDLLGASWLQIKATLPEDGVAHRFNKVGDALDVSHVQLAQYMTAAEEALREVLAVSVERPPLVKQRFHARDMGSMTGPMKFSEFNTAPERATFPTLGFGPQPEIRRGNQPMTVGDKDPVKREQEGVGVVAGAYEPIEPTFNGFVARAPGRYRITVMAHSAWVGPGPPDKWWRPDLDTVSRGRRSEPVTLYAEAPPRILRRLGAFDAGVEPTAGTFEVDLLPGETIRPDAARLFRSRPPNYHNPLAQKDGQPAIVYRWLDVEGPLVETWPPPARALLFGDLPAQLVQEAPKAGDKPGEKSGNRRSRTRAPRPSVTVTSTDPRSDATRLLTAFLERAYRGPVLSADVERFTALVMIALGKGAAFADAMITGYVAVLCSPRFLYLDERPGELDGTAVATRLSHFLWSTSPDQGLREAARGGALARPEALRTEVRRLLADPRSSRFVDGFLDYWLDLRRMDATGPDPLLYPDYYLDDLLTESAEAETRAFFSELLRENLPARNLVSSDFAMLNERLAAHYGLPAIGPDKRPLGVKPVRVPLPRDSVRGGLLTQAAILKVTANGTTTSPVLRGVWINERILGLDVPPPPTNVPAVEPDIRGASTIREQLDKHRADKSCAACHVKIDPAGFALEAFDVLGGQRAAYRALDDSAGATAGLTTAEAQALLATLPPRKPPRGYGKNGQPYEFHDAQPVDSTGALPNGKRFKDVVELKRLLAASERQLARNLLRQLAVYATGAPVRFGDRAALERILDRTARRAGGGAYGVRDLVTELVASPLFRRK